MGLSGRHTLSGCTTLHSLKKCYIYYRLSFSLQRDTQGFGSYPSENPQAFFKYDQADNERNTTAATGQQAKNKQSNFSEKFLIRSVGNNSPVNQHNARSGKKGPTDCKLPSAAQKELLQFFMCQNLLFHSPVHLSFFQFPYSENTAGFREIYRFTVYTV